MGIKSYIDNMKKEQLKRDTLGKRENTSQKMYGQYSCIKKQKTERQIESMVKSQNLHEELV